LGIRKLKHVYDMSFAEFQIRLFAWERLEARAWDKIRFVAFFSMKGSHMNPKIMPKTLTQFMKLSIDDKVAPVISEAQIQRFKEEMAKYVKQIR
jgi:hypothetical protein